MKTRTLGSLEVSALGLGCMSMSSGYGPPADKAEMIKLRYFLGCTMAEAAQILGIAHATAEEDWTYARAWLRRQWRRGESS